MDIKEYDITKNKILTTKNNLESLIESYRLKDDPLIISSNTPLHYVFSIIKENLDQGLSVKYIVELDIFKKLEIFRRFDFSNVKESLVEIPFHKKNFTLAQQILEKTFELYLEREFNYKVPYISFQLPSSAVNIAKNIIAKNYINQIFFNRFAKKILKKFEKYKISKIPEFLKIGKEKRQETNFTIIYNELLKIQQSKEDEIEDIINKLEHDFIIDLKNFYLEWNLDKYEERPFLISDTLNILFGFLFNKDDEFHPLIKGTLPKDSSNNVVLIIFDNLGYFDLVRNIRQSELWSEIEKKNEITINPAFSSFITTTEYALSYLIREDKGAKSLIEKIVDRMIEEKDPISIITCSQWNQNYPYNKKLFDSKRSGYLRIPDTIFTLNTLKPYLKELENKHYLIIYSCTGIPHENISFKILPEQIEQNVIKRISEAIKLFPNSTIIAIGDHGVQWIHQKIEGGDKLDNNKRISKVPIKDYSMEQIDINDHKILQLLHLETQKFYPLKPSYVLELPNTKIYHGGFSFSELVIPLIICKPMKKKRILEIEEELIIDSLVEKPKVEKEVLIPLEKIRDIILHYLETNGPSMNSKITDYVTNVKNKDFSENDINAYLRSLLKYGNVVKGNPSEGSGKRAKAIIWYLPKQKDQYEKILEETEEKFLTFIREKKACLFKTIHKGLSLKRGFTLSMLHRLIFHSKLEIKNFERALYIHNNLIYSKVSIYYIPGQEDYALKRISEVRSSSNVQRSQKVLLNRFDCLVKQLNKEIEFEVPEIIKSEALKITFQKISQELEKTGRRPGTKHVDLLGAALYLSLRKFYLPIPFDFISKAAVHTNIVLKNKDLEDIDDLDRLYSLKRKSIRKLSNEIRRILDFKIKPLSHKEYFDFIVMRLDCPYYIKHFGNIILKDLKNLVIPGIDPGGLAGAIVYYIIRKLKPLGICHKNYNQRSIAKTVGISEITLRKAVKLLEQNIRPVFSDEINIIKKNIEKSVEFKDLEILTQEGSVTLPDNKKNVEFILKDLIKNTLDYELTYNEEPSNKRTIDHKSLTFFLENNVIQGMLNEKYHILYTTQEFIKNIIPGQSRVFICQNTVDRNLQFSFTPKTVLLNIPLSYARNFIQLAGIELVEFYIQTKNSDFINLIILDEESIEEHSIALFDILEKLDLMEYQKSIVIPEINKQTLYEYILEFEESIEEENDIEKEIYKRKKIDLFQEWLLEGADAKKVKTQVLPKQTQDIVKPILKDLIEEFKFFIIKKAYFDILKTPKDCHYIINQSLEACYNNLYQPAFESILTSLERLLYNYHSKFLRTTERLDIYKFLKELWKERLISKDIRDQVNVISSCRNEVKHGRKDVDLNYFNTYFPLILDAIKKLCYEYFQIPAIHKVIEKLSNLEFIREHSLIPIKNEPEILKKWLFNKNEQMYIYERDETINDIDKFSIITEFFIDALKDKKRKKFYFSIEFDVHREETEYSIKKIREIE